jgi:hypothetical protein
VPVFYLHVRNGIGFVEDVEGHELADAAAAREVAIRSARDLMASEIRDGEMNLSSFIEVEDADHRHLFKLSFAEAVKITY